MVSWWVSLIHIVLHLTKKCWTSTWKSIFPISSPCWCLESDDQVVHVDYSICFDRGQRLRVPERVPFRILVSSCFKSGFFWDHSFETETIFLVHFLVGDSWTIRLSGKKKWQEIANPQKQKAPRWFPGFDRFRVSGLTRCMVHALGPLGLGGQFAHTMLGPPPDVGCQGSARMPSLKLTARTWITGVGRWVSFWEPIFRGYVSFREGNVYNMQHIVLVSTKSTREQCHPSLFVSSNSS